MPTDAMKWRCNARDFNGPLPDSAAGGILESSEEGDARLYISQTICSSHWQKSTEIPRQHGLGIKKSQASSSFSAFSESSANAGSYLKMVA